MARNIPTPAGGASALNQNTTTAENFNKNVTSQSNAQQNSVTNSVSNTQGSSSGREVFNADYLDPVARKALNDLIGQLSQGGTPEQRAAMEQRLNEIVANQGIRNQYSQGNAFAQAQGAANSALAKSLQATMPQIAASVDAAGVSGSSFSGLLTQQAAADAAAMAAELGLQTSVQYGQIQAGLSGVLEQLTRTDADPIVNSLLQALNIAKGATESGSKTSSSSTSSTTVGTETASVNTQQFGKEKTTGSGVTTLTNTPNKKTTTANNNYTGLSTPSSNRSSLTQSAAFKPGKTSYSQFG